MDQLPKSTQEYIRKTSTLRLQHNLLKVGFEEDVIAGLDRQQLMDKWAQVVIEGKDKPVEGAAAAVEKTPAPVGYDPEIERMRLQWEREKFDREMRMQEEMLKKKEEKIQIERAALKLQQEKVADEATKLKKYADALRGTIPKQTNDPIEVVAFFRNVERLFHDFKVPVELQAAIVKPFLTERAKALVAKLDPSKSSYKDIKEAILREYKVSAPMYREKFNDLVKSDDQTYVMYASSLMSLIDGYIEARKVTEFDDFRDLLVSDRLKVALKPTVLKYVLSVEAKSDKGWLKPYVLAEVVDDYVANYHDPTVPKSGVLGMTRQSSGPKTLPDTQGYRQSGLKSSSMRPLSTQGVEVKKSQLTCWHCGGPHLVRFCPKNKNSNQSPKTGNTVSRISKATVLPTSVDVMSDNFLSPGISPPKPSNSASCCAESDATDHVTTTDNVVQCCADDNNSVNRTTVDCMNKVSEFDTDCTIIESVKHPLSYVDVVVALPDTPDVCVKVKALNDSGSECALICQSVLQRVEQKDSVIAIGEVKIRGICGDPVLCPLVRLKVHQIGGEGEFIITAAVMNNLSEDLILPSTIVDCLQQMSTSMLDDAVTCEVEVKPNNDVPEFVDMDFDTQNQAVSENLQSPESRKQLISEQEADPSLKQCWSLLKRGKGNFCLNNGVLMRFEKILGQNYTQLVVPKSKRQQCLEFGHDMAGHMSPKKVSQRIRLNFWWPTMKADIHEYVRSCKQCQFYARKTCWDRVPIHATERHDTPFMHWHMDVLGPMSSEKMMFPYCLLLLDSYSRFPVAYPLRTPTAKNICDCLVQLWTFVGVPQSISLDNASYNVAGLTTELFRRFGVTPKFITPHHSEGNAAAERLIGTTKRLIAKSVDENPKCWHKHLPFVMWALRECPCSLTGLPPWLLAMGTIPRGPLTVLRECWTGEIDFPPNLGKAPEQYLRELHDNLEVAKRYADIHSKRMQDVYVKRYNLRSRDKDFKPGDSVLVLQPSTTTSRMFASWKGPASVVEKLSPYSYVVDLDGVHYRLHANHLKRFHTRVDEVQIDAYGLGDPNSLGNDSVHTEMCVTSRPDESCNDTDTADEVVNVSTCAMIRDEDTDFGEMSSCEPPKQTLLLPSQRLDEMDLSHLSDIEKQQLLAVLDRHADVFSDSPGLYKGVKHSIPVTADFRPRRLKEYKIPEKIKPEVMRQIQDLLDQGIIRPSNSPMSSPVVCLLKGPSGRDGVRLAVDYRYVNRYSISDAFPIGDIEDIIQRVGNSHCMSLCDATAGYWQTEIQEEDRWKTGFICDDQLYEWTRTPFGLKSSGQTFCRAVQQILHPIKNIAAAFVDDMVVYSGGLQQHLNDLDCYLAEIRKSGITLKLRKCRFALPEIKFCGQIIGCGKRRADPEKLAAIDAIKVPETKKKVRQLMGFFNYFRNCIPNFAEIAKPITDLTKKTHTNKIICGTSELAAIQKMKDALCSATENPLYIIDSDKEFNLLVDASSHTVAGALTQTTADGVEHPIAFFSWKLNDTQQNWAVVEKEAYAALKSLQRVKQWVFGHKICVFSDHNPLTYLTNSAPKSSKLLRWALALQEFDVTFKYRAGQFHVVPDVLSRMC